MIYAFAVIVSILGICSFYKYLSLKRTLSNINECLKERINDDDYSEFLEPSGDSEIQNLLITINRINNAKRREEMLRKEKEKTLHEMLSNVSHDLKTPLTVILGYIEMLDSDNLDIEERCDIQKRLIKKINHVITLINKFFSLAKLESGDEIIRFEKVNLTEVVKENLIFFEEILVRKNFQVFIDWDDRDIFIHSNKYALYRIINNLFSNVIRYGHHGKYLGIHLREFESNVTLQVIDKGQGICNKDINRIFERSFTGSNSRNSEEVGNGLGLAIVSTLSEKLGGTIEVQSEINNETIFTLKLFK